MRREPEWSLANRKIPGKTGEKIACLRRNRQREMEVSMADYKRGDTASWDAEQVRRSEQPRQVSRKSRKRKKKKRINPLLYILFVVVTSALLAGVGWLLASDLCAFNKEYKEETIQITSEDTVATVADKLQEAGLINYKWFFRLFANFAHAEEKIGMGTYALNTEMDYRALIVGMRSTSGNMTAETVRVTIPEGYTVAETIELLAKNNVSSKEDLLTAAKTYNFKYDFIDNETEDISRLEGYLFPDTYEFYVNGKASAALNKMIATFNSRLDDDLLAQAKERGYDLQKIVTIASLIEKETDGTDHGKIASVIYNRLEGPGDKGGTYGMLQIDAALLYALPGHEGAITNSDKETDSPYNLYKKAGLPPTAIANPGMAAIRAALEPENTDYYYYALGKDHRHRFFTNYNDHLNFVNSSEYIGN